MKKTMFGIAFTAAVAIAPGLQAQSFPTDDPVIRQMWDEGMEEKSQVYDLAQALLDSIGPRLLGSPQFEQAGDWLLSKYAEWGVEVEKQVFGTWRGWERGPTHVDLISPRVRSLNATMLAWSPGTDRPIDADVVLMPPFQNSDEFEAWLPAAQGKAVAISFPEPSCRAPESWAEHAMPATWEREQAARTDAARAWAMSTRAAGGRELGPRLEAAGAVAVLSSRWSRGWGADKIFSSFTESVPSIHLSCEDYGLVARMAERGQSPRVRIEAESEFLGDVPNFNIVGMLRGTELPDEYVLLSAHLDSWDGASGATDNGTGTIMMMEAMRILKAAYPNPRRTILVGHWGGEEQGLVGSRAFVEDHPDIIEGMQSVFNQDNGAWRVDFVRMQGFTGAGAHFARWFSVIPNEITDQIELDVPSVPEGIRLPGLGRDKRSPGGGSDHMAFTCIPVPAFRFQSNYPDYRQYTWHTGIDTFDKLIFDDLRNNATLAAMTAYMASEDPERVPRDTRLLPENPRTGEPATWPGCGQARRSYGN
jgi:carboxypeptidase Q